MFFVLGGIATIGVVAVASGLYWAANSYAKPYMPDANSLVGKTIVITGATTGLGLESAKRLAAGGANVILTSRTTSKGEIAVQEIRKYLANEINVSYDQQMVAYKVLDFNDLNAVKANLAQLWGDVEKVDVLLNNAGALYEEHMLTVDGFERTIQSNHLGHFVLTALLYPRMSKDARIVNVSSNAHGFVPNGLPFDNLWKAEKSFGTFPTYAVSKLANILFTEELQRRLSKATSPIVAFSVHPGVVSTDIGRDVDGKIIGKLFSWFVKTFSNIGVTKTVSNGSATQVWLSATPNISEEMKGKYFVDCAVTKVSAKTPESDAARLWEESEQMSGVKFAII
jgi:NAD(P)-dependent dehydrogenase (short-subunit alcohol dehydrogenase family)